MLLKVYFFATRAKTDVATSSISALQGRGCCDNRCWPWRCLPVDFFRNLCKMEKNCVECL